MRKEYKDILTVVRRGFSNGLYMDTEFLNGLHVVMRCSKKLCYFLALEVDDAIFYKSTGLGWRSGNDESGFRDLDSCVYL